MEYIWVSWPPIVTVSTGTSPTMATEEKKSQPNSLREAEDQVQKVLDNMTEPLQALLYKILYNQGMRLTSAEDMVRRTFKA